METTEEKIYTEEDIQSCIKPLSNNGFIRFFQSLWRKWLGVWYGFAEKKPKLADWIYKIGFFCVFSFSVTVYQFIIMTFLPYAFESLNNGPAGFPQIPIAAAGGKNFTIFGDENGWGYFIAFELAVFTAQCINFPLQRNVTYKSHGNPWVQAAWYFIGWVVVSVATDALWGVCNAFLLHWGSPEVLNGLIKTLLTGFVSMVVFFFIFLKIFPDLNKTAARAEKNYEKLKAKGASAEKLEKAELKKNLAREKADEFNAEQAANKASSLASARAIKYFAFKKECAQAEELYNNMVSAAAPAGELEKAEQNLAAAREKTEKAYAQAIEACKKL
ncbi:MAG: hypothetical protein K2N22_04750 [Clostridia bacterium]|nr:hypothetical protein [Clostridia bacterium]